MSFQSPLASQPVHQDEKLRQVIKLSAISGAHTVSGRTATALHGRENQILKNATSYFPIEIRQNINKLFQRTTQNSRKRSMFYDW